MRSSDAPSPVARARPAVATSASETTEATTVPAKDQAASVSSAPNRRNQRNPYTAENAVPPGSELVIACEAKVIFKSEPSGGRRPPHRRNSYCSPAKQTNEASSTTSAGGIHHHLRFPKTVENPESSPRCDESAHRARATNADAEHEPALPARHVAAGQGHVPRATRWTVDRRIPRRPSCDGAVTPKCLVDPSVDSGREAVLHKRGVQLVEHPTECGLFRSRPRRRPAPRYPGDAPAPPLPSSGGPPPSKGSWTSAGHSDPGRRSTKPPVSRAASWRVTVEASRFSAVASAFVLRGPRSSMVRNAR